MLLNVIQTIVFRTQTDVRWFNCIITCIYVNTLTKSFDAFRSNILENMNDWKGKRGIILASHRFFYLKNNTPIDSRCINIKCSFSSIRSPNELERYHILDISIDQYPASSGALLTEDMLDSASHNSTAHFLHKCANLFLTCRRPSGRIKTGPAGLRILVRVNPFSRS